MLGSPEDEIINFEEVIKLKDKFEGDFDFLLVHGSHN